MPFKEATFWYGTLLFGTGLYFWTVGGDDMTAGIVLTLTGLAMSVYAVVAHHQPKLPKLRFWVASLLLTWGALGYDIYDRRHPSFIWVWFASFLGIAIFAVAMVAWFQKKHTALTDDKLKELEAKIPDITVNGILAGLPKQPATPSLPAPKLTIHSAVYGAGETFKDVTAILRGHSRDALVLDVENDSFGIDPVPMKPKRLRVEYSYNNSMRHTVTRWEHARLVLPEDSEIQRLTNEVEKMKEEASAKSERHFPRHVFTVQEVSADPPMTDPGIFYKDKIRVILTNHLDTEVFVWTPMWQASASEVSCQHPLGSLLQLEGQKGWRARHWKEEEVESAKIPVGATFRCWIGLVPPIGQSIHRRLQTRTPIGTAIFPVKINGKLYEVPINMI